MIQPRWVWEFTDTDGQVLDGAVSPVFTEQFDAEQWLGESWRQVVTVGATGARLLHDGVPAAPAVDLRPTV